MDAYVGMVAPMAIGYAPVGWMSCEGQSLPIAQNEALYTLIGTMYGGDGVTSFNIPDLRGRRIIGQDPRNNAVPVGAKGGAEQVTMSNSTMPAHTHAFVVNAMTNDQSQTVPTNNILGGGGAPALAVYTDTPTDCTLSTDAAVAAIAGGSLPIQTLSPYVAMYMVICVNGIFPTRN